MLNLDSPLLKLQSRKQECFLINIYNSTKLLTYLHAEVRIMGVSTLTDWFPPHCTSGSPGPGCPQCVTAIGSLPWTKYGVRDHQICLCSFNSAITLSVTQGVHLYTCLYACTTCLKACDTRFWHHAIKTLIWCAGTQPSYYFWHFKLKNHRK